MTEKGSEVADPASLQDIVEAIKKDVKAVKESLQWNVTRLGALILFIGSFLAYYLTSIQTSTVTVLLVTTSLIFAAIIVFIVLGIGKKVTMFVMDVLTIRNWEWEYKGKL